MKLPPRINVIGSAVSVCQVPAALDVLGTTLESGSGGYVCFTNVHTAVMARRDAALKSIADRSLLSVADGKPIYWLGRAKFGKRISLGHIPGPDFLLHVLRRFPRRRHFFYGSSPEVLELLIVELRRLVPDANICGVLSPPFRQLTESEKNEYQRMIREATPDFIWVGLGAPKQEQWMADFWQGLQPSILLGVGAAFDFYAGTVNRAPPLMRRLGFEWLYRVFKEPRRLWKRYTVTNSLFMAYVLRDWVAGLLRRAPTGGPIP